ncbi:MAG TPA: NAD(P)H-binding protein [Acidimicrobiales bacterium]|nr:NAD(P)H-binding protein [Acidimicrobiales bacterium]
MTHTPMTDTHTPHTTPFPGFTDPRPVLVTGGTGKTGRRVASRLAARGVPVRLGSRAARPAFAWDDPATWGPALDGTRAVYLAYAPDLALDGAAEVVGAVAAEARARGAERVVLLSGRGEEGAERGERAVQRSGLDWTVVRAAWFDQNFSEGYLLDAVMDGVVAFPAGDIAEPFVDADDVAEVAAAALCEPGHAGRLYEVTGPDLLTWGEAVAELGAASGRAVTYQPIGIDDYAAGARAEGYPDDLVDMLVDLFRQVLDGHNAYVTGGVEEALGRPARSFTDFARDAARAGAWA